MHHPSRWGWCLRSQFDSSSQKICIACENSVPSLDWKEKKRNMYVVSLSWSTRAGAPCLYYKKKRRRSVTGCCSNWCFEGNKDDSFWGLVSFPLIFYFLPFLLTHRLSAARLFFFFFTVSALRGRCKVSLNNTITIRWPFMSSAALLCEWCSASCIIKCASGYLSCSCGEINTKMEKDSASL